MSTYTAIHIETDNESGIRAYFVSWLQRIHKEATVKWSDGLFPNDFYREPQFLPTETNPDTVVMALTQPNWVTAYYNSFSEMKEPAHELSLQLQTITVVVMAQSVSEAYFISVCKNGQCLRTIEYAGDQGEWTRQEGSPLSFESVPLGTNLMADEPDEEPFYQFGHDDAVAYCKGLGLNIWKDDDVSVWTYIKAHKPRPIQTKKPKWQFWK